MCRCGDTATPSTPTGKFSTILVKSLDAADSPNAVGQNKVPRNVNERITRTGYRKLKKVWNRSQVAQHTFNASSWIEEVALKDAESALDGNFIHQPPGIQKCHIEGFVA